MSETTVWGCLGFILLTVREGFQVALRFCSLEFLIYLLCSSVSTSVPTPSFSSLAASPFLCFKRLQEKCICCRISAYSSVVGNSHPWNWLKECCSQSRTLDISCSGGDLLCCSMLQDDSRSTLVPFGNKQFSIHWAVFHKHFCQITTEPGS